MSAATGGRDAGGAGGSVDEARIAQALRETFHTWDEPSATSAAEHGDDTLVRQEARRLRVTMALLDAAPPARVLEVNA